MEQSVFNGMRVYSQRVLANYDLFVLGFSNRFVWRCPSKNILRLYNENVSTNHLDIGVGTGYFLDHCTFPNLNPRIHLVDLNENCLAKTAERLHRYHPETFKRNVLQPFELDDNKYDSVALNYLFHCLPGSMEEKAEKVVTAVKPHLKPDGVLFGSTILNTCKDHNKLSIKFSTFYNAKGIFSNQEDTSEDLKSVLKAHFSEVAVREIGCVALFTASNPK